jgi:hypothetical protein
MKNLKTLMILLAFVLVGGAMAACDDGGNGHEDADGDVEVEDVPIEDVRPDDVTPDDVTPDDVVTDDVVTDDVVTDDVVTDDVVTDDVVTDDVPTDEVPACDATAITCGGTLSGETTIGVADAMNGYSCASGLDESGGEKVYSISTTTNQVVTFAITITTADQDLDVFVLSGGCDTASCVDYGAASGTADEASFTAEAGLTYYVVVDGYAGAAGQFDVTVTCADAETCDDGIDNNGNALIDCSDPECAGTTACTETVCNDTTDNDHDGMADCLDADCVDATNCYESGCSDTTDNDGDGDVDCDDMDCFGDTACATGSAAIGEACTANDDCSSGACWTELLSGYPGGYCLTLGYTDCTGTCPTGSTCVEFSGWGLGPWGCLDDCDAGACRTGYRCYSTDLPICIAGCTDNAQCTVTGSCDIYDPVEGGGFCNPIAENCSNTIDDDGDNKIDCADSECAYTAACATVTPLAGGDTCATAAALTMPSGERGQVVVSGTTTGMANDLMLDCAYGDSNDVVYSFTLTSPAFVLVDVVGGPNPPMSNDTAISIRLDCAAGPDLLCNDDMESYYHSQVYGSFTAGTYSIIIDGYDATSPGDYNLSVVFSNLP